MRDTVDSSALGDDGEVVQYNEVFAAIMLVTHLDRRSKSFATRWCFTVSHMELDSMHALPRAKITYTSHYGIQASSTVATVPAESGILSAFIEHVLVHIEELLAWSWWRNHFGGDILI